MAGLVFMESGGIISILDEAKNTGCAREMLETDEWVFSTFNYSLRAQKPPLHYYFRALSWRIFGVSKFGARLLEEWVVFFSGLVLLSSSSVFDLGQFAAAYCPLLFHHYKSKTIQFGIGLPSTCSAYGISATRIVRTGYR